MKNKPKIRSLTEKQAKVRWQENSTKRKSARKSNKKSWWQIRKNKFKITKFSPKHSQYAFRNKLKQKIAIKFEEKAIGKTEICKKQAQKTSKLQLKQAQKQATRKFSKKTSIPQKNKPNFAGKPQGWQHSISTFGCMLEVHRIRFSGLESDGIQHILNKLDWIQTTVLLKFPDQDQDFQIYFFVGFDANTIVKRIFAKI